MGLNEQWRIIFYFDSFQKPLFQNKNIEPAIGLDSWHTYSNQYNSRPNDMTNCYFFLRSLVKTSVSYHTNNVSFKNSDKMLTIRKAWILIWIITVPNYNYIYTEFHKACTRDPGINEPWMDTTCTCLSTLQATPNLYQMIMYLAWEDMAVQKHTYMANFSMRSIIFHALIIYSNGGSYIRNCLQLELPNVHLLWVRMFSQALCTKW